MKEAIYINEKGNIILLSLKRIEYATPIIFRTNSYNEDISYFEKKQAREYLIENGYELIGYV
jgi:hypothetical protein